MSAKDQLLLARQNGHELSIVTRGPWPEHGDPHPKYYVSCSCGWQFKNATRSKKAANIAMVWHLGDAISDAVIESHPVPQPPDASSPGHPERGARASSTG